MTTLCASALNPTSKGMLKDTTPLVNKFVQENMMYDFKWW